MKLQQISPKDKWRALLGLSMVFALLGALEFNSPNRPPFQGLWAFVYSTANQILGTYGVAYYFFAWSAILLAMAAKAWINSKG